MISEKFLDEIKKDIPIPNKTIIRKEKKGAILFNVNRLNYFYVDETGATIFKLIDGKKNIIEIFESVKKTTKIPKIFLAVIFLNFLDFLKRNDFINLDSEIPHSNYSTSQKNRPRFSAPNQVHWMITNKCNLRCSHCANKSSKKLNNELTTLEALELVETLSEMKVFILSISGGEPFIREDIFEILSRARELNIEIGITSNGTLFDENIAKRLKDISPFNVHLSLDGIGKIHDDFRNQEGVYEKVIDSINLFRKYDIPFGITTSITKKNLNNLNDIKKFVIEKEIRSWEIFYAIPIGNLKKDMSLSTQEYLSLAIEISKIREELKDHCQVFVGDSLGYFSSFKIRDQEWQGCFAGLNHCAIGPEGEIKGCPIQPDEFIVGNIRDKSLVEIWNDPKLFFYNKNKNKFEKHCKICEYLNQCGGGCKTSMFSQNTKMTYNDYCLKDIENIN